VTVLFLASVPIAMFKMPGKKAVPRSPVLMIAVQESSKKTTTVAPDPAVMIPLAVVLLMIIAMIETCLAIVMMKIMVVAEGAVVSANLHPVGRHTKADRLLDPELMKVEMAGRTEAETETDQSVVHLRFEVDTEVALLILTIVVAEVVAEEDVVTIKATQSREVSLVPSVPELQMANLTKIARVLIEAAKVVSDTALFVTTLFDSVMRLLYYGVVDEVVAFGWR
jgi:hypothetical protein